MRPESGVEEWKPTEEEEEEEKPEPGNVAAMEDDVQSEGRKVSEYQRGTVWLLHSV